MQNEKNQKVKELYDRLKAGVEDVLASGKIEEILRLQARFHKYSFGNMLLIFQQMPGASQVAGFHTWKNLGRNVKKGEHGIKIFAPCPYKTAVTDPETGEEIEKIVNYFKVVTVFDISQTEGKSLPGMDDEAEPVKATMAGEELHGRLLAVSPVPVRIGDCNGADGYYSIEAKEIVLDSGLTGDKRAGTLLHEIAHALAFQVGEQKRHKSRKDEEYIKGEIVAEGAAYVAGIYFGVEVPGSFDYVAGWAKKPEIALKWGESVQKVAKMLIDLVEKAEQAA